jgi:hypothetical protein
MWEAISVLLAVVFVVPVIAVIAVLIGAMLWPVVVVVSLPILTIYYWIKEGILGWTTNA